MQTLMVCRTVRTLPFWGYSQEAFAKEQAHIHYIAQPVDSVGVSPLLTSLIRTILFPHYAAELKTSRKEI